MAKAWVSAVRERWKELLARRQVGEVANDALPFDNIYLMEGEGTRRSNSTRIPQALDAGPLGKASTIPEVERTAVAAARRGRVE
jgi:hypothetical protein